MAKEQDRSQRKDVMTSVRWSLPPGISDEDEQSILDEIKEALDELPAGSSKKDLEAARDEIISEYRAKYDAKAKAADRKAERAKNKAHLVAAGLQAIYPHAQRLIRKYDYDKQESPWRIEMRVKKEIQEALNDELGGNEDARAPDGLLFGLPIPAPVL